MRPRISETGSTFGRTHFRYWSRRRRFRRRSSSSRLGGRPRSELRNGLPPRSPPRPRYGGRPPEYDRNSRRPYRGPPRASGRPPPPSLRRGKVNRFPHASHSPTRLPSSPVEKRRGAPHLRHGLPRGAPESNLSDGSRSCSARKRSRWGTNTVVVSQSGQIASSEPLGPWRNERGDPHVSHSGPSSAIDPSPFAEAGAGGGEPRREATLVPSTNANSFAHEGQVPVRSRTSRCSKSIEEPHSGQEFFMETLRRDPELPHYIRRAMVVRARARARSPMFPVSTLPKREPGPVPRHALSEII